MEEKLKQQPSECIKIVLFGPESTGKTTLAMELANYYDTAWVPEFSRAFAMEKAAHNDRITEADILLIAEGQMRLENSLAKSAKSVLICDTDLLETLVYADIYFSQSPDETLKKFAFENQYDLYFLMYIDIPWEADDIRDKPHSREVDFDTFKKALESYEKPYVLLKGNRKERFETAIRHIDKLIDNLSEFHR